MEVPWEPTSLNHFQDQQWERTDAGFVGFVLIAYARRNAEMQRVLFLRQTQRAEKIARGRGGGRDLCRARQGLYRRENTAGELFFVKTVQRFRGTRRRPIRFPRRFVEPRKRNGFVFVFFFPSATCTASA